MRIISFGKSDVGLRRSNNEDSFLIIPEAGVFCIGDGMGGAAAGEVASRIFVDTVIEIFQNATVQSEDEALELLKKTFRSSNERIFQESKEKPEYNGMGCTAELAFFYNEKYLLGHVGDSRSYLFRQGKLRQITRDHSLVQNQIDQGIITPTDAKKHSLRNVILKAVGISEILEVDIIRGKTLPEDIFLLCSDGLTDMIDDNSIQHVLSPLSIAIDQKVDKLIELAKASGGHDNVTVILCKIKE